MWYNPLTKYGKIRWWPYDIIGWESPSINQCKWVGVLDPAYVRSRHRWSDHSCRQTMEIPPVWDDIPTKNFTSGDFSASNIWLPEGIWKGGMNIHSNPATLIWQRGWYRFLIRPRLVSLPRQSSGPEIAATLSSFHRWRNWSPYGSGVSDRAIPSISHMFGSPYGGRMWQIEKGWKGCLDLLDPLDLQEMHTLARRCRPSQASERSWNQQQVPPERTCRNVAERSQRSGELVELILGSRTTSQTSPR